MGAFTLRFIIRSAYNLLSELTCDVVELYITTELICAESPLQFELYSSKRGVTFSPQMSISMSKYAYLKKTRQILKTIIKDDLTMI